VNNGPVYPSNNEVVVTGVMPSADGTEIFVLAEITTVLVRLGFSLHLATAPGETAALLRLTVTNTSEDEIVLKTVYPRIRGLVTRGHPRDMMGMVPHEIGSVVPLQVAPPGAHLAAVLRDTKTPRIPTRRRRTFSSSAMTVPCGAPLWSTPEDGRRHFA
jgi:hypothetical protein